MTAVADRADHAVAKLQHHNRGVHITHRTNGRIVHHVRQDKELLHFAADQKTGHIEVMDRHVKEDAARYANIINWWRIGIAADDMEQMWAANLSLFHSLPYTSIISIKAPVKADLQFDTSPFDSLQRAVD